MNETLESIVNAAESIINAQHPDCRITRMESCGRVTLEVFPNATHAIGRQRQLKPFAYEIRGPLVLGAE